MTTKLIKAMGLAPLALFVLAGCGKSGDSSANPVSVDTVPAKMGSADESVMSPGTIVPANTVNVTVPPSPPMEGFSGTVRGVYVKVGDRVKKGQLLAELDGSEQAAVVNERAAKTLEAEKHYDLVRHMYRPEQIEVQRLQIVEDGKNIDSSRAHLQLLLDGNRPEQIDQAKAALDQQQTLLDQLVKDNTRSHALFDKDLISRSDLEKNDEMVAAQKDVVAQAANQLKIYQLGARSEDIAAARDDVQKFRSVRDKDEETLKVMLLGARPEAIAEAKQAIDQAKAAENLQRQVLTHQYIRAPQAGIIVERNINPGEAAGPNLGARSDSSDPLRQNTEALFEIADDDSVEFMANVDQLFFQNVYTGQQATLTVEALPGETFGAKITRIQPLVSSLEHNKPGESNPSTPLTFMVWADISNSAHKLVPGQTGIISAKKRVAGLVVPQAAVSAYNLGQGGVYVVQNGVAHMKQVRYEATSGGYVKILDGLKEGDQVVVSNLANLHDGLSVHPRPSNVAALSPRAAGL
ncbi:MAG TPA: efflux RND transporter periplasmic adaptor subunit [Fimbriimonadaceae bacterium]|jgi:RND family efflux transporter MFP subunit